MIDFFQALRDPDVWFLRDALLAGVLASVSLGIIGAYVVTRRISYLGGAISHCVLSGIGLGLFLQKVGGYAWCHPMYGAVLSALLAALLIGLVSLYAHQRETPSSAPFGPSAWPSASCSLPPRPATPIR